MSQVSYGTITVSDLTDITNVYLEYAKVADNIKREEDIPNDTIWSKIYPEWQSGYQIWIRQVTKKEGLPNEYGTPYLDKAINQTNNNINRIDNKLKAFFWPGDTNYSGAYVVAKTTDDGLNQNDINTYGYNVGIRPASIAIGYNNAPVIQLSEENGSLNIYQPPTITTDNNIETVIPGNLMMNLSGGELNFYGSNSQNPDSQLGINGLITTKGEIGGWIINDNSLHSSNKNTWNTDIDGIYIGKNTDNQQNPIFTISGGRIQYVLTDDTEVNEEVVYYKAVYELSTDTTIDSSKTYYIKDPNKEKYTQVVNPSGNPSALNYYERTDDYSIVENPGNENPKNMGWYKNLGPMWYINSDGSASFGSLLVNQTGILDVPAASIRGKLNADQIEVESLWAENASIGATADRAGSSNSLIVDSEYTYILSLDTRPHPNKIYYKEYNDYIRVDSSETVVIEGKDYFENIGTVEKPIYVIVDNTDGKNPYAEGWFEFREYSQLSNTYVQNKNPYEEGWFEKTEKSHIVLESNKITYLQTEDTTIQTGQDYYEYKVSYVPTTDVTPQKNKDYYTIGGIEYILSTDTEINVNKDYYELDDGEYKKVTPNAGDNPQSNSWYEIFIPYNLITSVSSRSNPNSEKWYEKNISYQLVSNPTGIPKNNYWYTQSTTFNVNLTLEDAELLIKSDNNELLNINPKEEKDINISALQITNRIKIGQLEIATYNNGIAIRPISEDI